MMVIENELLIEMNDEETIVTEEVKNNEEVVENNETTDENNEVPTEVEPYVAGDTEENEDEDTNDEEEKEGKKIEGAGENPDILKQDPFAKEDEDEDDDDEY